MSPPFICIFPPTVEVDVDEWMAVEERQYFDDDRLNVVT